MSLERLIVRTANASGTGDVVGTPNGIIDAALEVLQGEVHDLSNITLHVVQLVDAGTVVAHVEVTLDGTNWEQVGANVTEASFAAINNTAILRSLSDANGMPLAYQRVRLRCSALAGGGTYGFVVAGRQKHFN